MSIDDLNENKLELAASNLMTDMAEILKNKVVERHSYFQMKYFIVHKEPTIQAKLWQCLREIKTRFESLEAVSLEIEEGKDNLELINIKIDKLSKKIENFKENGETTKRELEIELRKLGRKKIAGVKNVQKIQEKRKSLEEESRFFVEIFKSLIQTEKLKPFDDFDSQCEYWGERLQNKLNLKMLTQGNLDADLIETILALPDRIPVKENTLKSLELRNQKMQMLLNQTMTSKE
jgi:hypothetical protein